MSNPCRSSKMCGFIEGCLYIILAVQAEQSTLKRISNWPLYKRVKPPCLFGTPDAGPLCPSVRPVPCPANNFKTTVGI